MKKQDNATTAGMTQDREANILEGAIAKWGTHAQICKAIEELGELQVELARILNGIGNENAVREELADAFVMCNQLEMMFGDVTEIEIQKLVRLEGMIGNAQV